MKRKDIFSKRPVLFDGALGTELASRAKNFKCPEELNITAPDVVCSLHSDYIKAGADVITTNTFSANEAALKRLGLFSKFEEINSAAINTAERAGKGKVLIAGSIGPTGVGNTPDKSLTTIFYNQASLICKGVDIVVLETFYNIKELWCAVEGVRRACDKPIVAMLVVNENLKTPVTGDGPHEYCPILNDLPVDAVGFNCGPGFMHIKKPVEELKKFTGKPIIAKPSAGLPGKYATPHDMAAKILELWEHIWAVGGCCGTTPAHISAMFSMIRSLPHSEESSPSAADSISSS